jgi:hypothetical protein
VETIVTALGVKPQKVIAQQRQFFVLMKRPNDALKDALGRVRSRNVSIVHTMLLSVTLEEASNP